ncbi:MAG: hypothetical protein PUB32_03215 [Clostridiales bacterium]|nr:hypothetical protein [Clostridiales bacterium]
MDELAPENHLARKLEAAMNCNFAYDSVEDKCSKKIGNITTRNERN